MKAVDHAARLLASIVALLVAVSTLPVTAQTLEEAEAAYQRGDFTTALLGLGSYVDQGNARAQFLIGRMYENGEGLPQDYESAGSWYRFAAEQGHPEAQYHLGRMYEDGRGVPQDDTQAVWWYRLAAEQGETSAQLVLGVMYATGRGVPQDDTAAVRWYRKAAEQGNALAQFSTGFMYANAKGVPQDDAEAARWFALAAEQGLAFAQLSLGIMYANGRGVHQDDAEAVRLYRLAAWQGEATAQLHLGLHYEFGKGVESNFIQAHKWYTLAASRFPPSERNLHSEAVHGRERVASQMAPAELVEAEILAREWIPGERVAQRMTRREPEPMRRPFERESAGSGFQVSSQGHILTNAHVVRGCTEVHIPSVGPVRVLALEDSSDLALLRAPAETSDAIARFRQGRGIRPGASIVAIGYPLRGILASGASVSTGAVSALAGPGDDRRLIQISAPIQPGNSGGPVLDTAGNVVGVVVAKLDALKIVQSIGDIPQNVNFAVSAGSVRAFLDDNGVPYETAPSDKAMEPVEIAAAAKQFTVLVECWK